MDFRVDRFAQIKLVPARQWSAQALALRAPQAEMIAERTANRLRPFLAVIYNSRRRIGTGLVALLTLWLFLHVMFGANGMVVYRQKKAEFHNLQKELAGLQQENSRYTRQIKALQTDPETIEKEAREQLHYARPGEVVYIAPDAAAQMPAIGQARR